MRAPFVIVIALTGCGGTVAPAPRPVAPAPTAMASPSAVAEETPEEPAKLWTKPDADADGIPDDDDKCPNEPETYNGYQDEDGCPDKGKVVIVSSNPPYVERVLFAKGQKTPTVSSEPVIDAVAQVMKAHPEIDLVQIEGHTDKHEPNALKLSQARADAVKVSLVKKGIDASRLRAKGFAAHCGAQADADADRRVEFKIAMRNGKPSSVALGCPAATAAGIAPD